MIPYLLAAVGGYLIGDSMKSQKLDKFADGGQLSSKQLQMLNAGFTFTIFTDYDNHFISIEKVNNKIEYIVRKGRVFDSKKVKSFNSKEEAFSFLSSKAGRKIGTRED